VVTLVYPKLEALLERYKGRQVASALKGSHFDVNVEGNGCLLVTDPWGTRFRLVEGDESERDSRGCQPGDQSEGLAMKDLTIFVKKDANLNGIGRFYSEILGGKLAKLDNDVVQIEMGPLQTLTFVPKEGITTDSHVDLREEEVGENDERMPEGCPAYPGNYGIHISLYVADLASAYQRAADLGVAYVNTRFSRRAYTLEQAIDDCMFRTLDVVDPENIQDGPILQLEHEVRSVVKRDGTKYKSCPFDAIPEGCAGSPPLQS